MTRLKTEKGLIATVIKDTAPVIAGYVILGIGFGIIMSAAGYGAFAVPMSLFIYAGSMQYAAIGLFTGGASFITVALTTLAVNARHLFYGISMLEKYKNTGAKKPYLIFALTDETYSLVCSTDRGTNYCFWVSLFNQLYWVGGTAAGVLLGSSISFNTKGLDFALTALFITVFLGQWLENENHTPALTGLLGSVLMLVIFGPGNFLIPSMLLISAVLLLIPGGDAE